jgi:hypothetical protein
LSDTEDQRKVHNLQSAEDRKVSEAERLAEMNRERMVAESYLDPRLIVFREKRKIQTMQTRWWKTSLTSALPKKRKFYKSKAL